MFSMQLITNVSYLIIKLSQLKSQVQLASGTRIIRENANSRQLGYWWHFFVNWQDNSITLLNYPAPLLIVECNK